MPEREPAPDRFVPDPRYLLCPLSGPEAIADFLHQQWLDRLPAEKYWASVTEQPQTVNTAHFAQQLATLVTGIPGSRSGARGIDLLDGSEVKSCFYIDQLDRCSRPDCAKRLFRWDEACSCGSTRIKRNHDSNWAITLTSEEAAEVLLGRPRLVCIVADYPNFAEGDWETLVLRMYEIWPAHERSRALRAIIERYLTEIYLPKRALGKRPAPKTFYPESYDFYRTAPVLSFEAYVYEARTRPELEITTLLEREQDRREIAPAPTPRRVFGKQSDQRFAAALAALGLDAPDFEQAFPLSADQLAVLSAL